MNIVVLIAGVHDPKWPIQFAAGGAFVPPREYQVFSPFDEAALEIALRLRLRDGQAGSRITAYVAGGPEGEKIARAVAALGIPQVSTLALDEPWDQAATVRVLAPLCAGADLVLIGREFGDYDDGLVPALLAGALRVPLFARVQTVEVSGDVRLMREAEASTETLTLSAPVVASVTNDRRTRLRKPLMKNVMQARQAAIGEVLTQAAPTPGLALGAVRPRSAGRGQTDCTRIAGEPAEQAQALAALLWEARA